MTEQEIAHHKFIVLTDRRSLYDQLRTIVIKAQEVANARLKERRKELQKLLEYEDQIYEAEFVSKVKSRMDEDIQARKGSLMKIKEANDKNAQEFLKKKRLQQYMNSCYVIRDALRHKELQNTKQSLLEQITEKERSIMREKEQDRFWMNVMKANAEIEDQRQLNEDCLRKQVIAKAQRVLEAQLEEKAERREEERREKQAEIEQVAKVREEMRLEDFDRKMKTSSAKVTQYRNELLADVEKRRCARLMAREEEAEEHRKMIAENQRLDEADRVAAMEKKRAAHDATIEYIAYVKRLKQMMQQQQDMRDGRLEELGRVDLCTKNNIQEQLKRKAEIAAASYAVLRKQICEQMERRMRDELERREDKMLINPYGKAEVSPEQTWQKRMQMRRDLDAQIVEMNRLRRLEEEKYEAELLRARDDQELCEELTRRVINEGLDYLPAHPDWKVLLCPSVCCEYVPKAPQAYPDCKDHPGHAPMLCGCAKRFQEPCRKSSGCGDK